MFYGDPVGQSLGLVQETESLHIFAAVHKYNVLVLQGKYIFPHIYTQLKLTFLAFFLKHRNNPN